jgi:CubicO group peptidase (beta-lactamase class C family)
MSAEEKWSGLGGWLRGMMERELTPCVTLAVMKEGRLVYSFAEGRSRLDGDGAVAVDNGTQFNTGSVTKTVTASLVIKLAETGLLTLLDPVKKHVPEYPFETVTVLNLLTHTAGYDEALDRSIPWPRSTSDMEGFYHQIYSIRQLKYAPDAECHYFTQGYVILQDVIQRITSQPIEQFAREILFDPLEMVATTYDTDNLREGRFVLPWKRSDPDRFSSVRHAPPTGDNGLYSTALDMVKFANLFLTDGIHEGKRLFSKASMDLMLREVTGGRFSKTPVFWRKGDGPFRYAFGDLSSPIALCHPGFSGTLLGIDPEYGMAFAFITNSNDIHDDYANFRKVFNRVTAAFV